jgi:transcriptional regulator with XRE-family HTH domain
MAFSRPVVPEPAAHFGEVLRRLRRASGLTQRELATRVGTTQSYLSEVESGKRPSVSRQLIGALARALELDQPNAAYLYESAGFVPSREAAGLGQEDRTANQPGSLPIRDAELIYRRLVAPSGFSPAKMRDLMIRLDSWDLLQQASVAALSDYALASYICRLIRTNQAGSPLNHYVEELESRLQEGSGQRTYEE